MNGNCHFTPKALSIWLRRRGEDSDAFACHDRLHFIWLNFFCILILYDYVSKFEAISEVAFSIRKASSEYDIWLLLLLGNGVNRVHMNRDELIRSILIKEGEEIGERDGKAILKLNIYEKFNIYCEKVVTLSIAKLSSLFFMRSNFISLLNC